MRSIASKAYVLSEQSKEPIRNVEIHDVFFILTCGIGAMTGSMHLTFLMHM